MKCVLLNKEFCSCSFMQIETVFSMDVQEYLSICYFLQKEDCILLKGVNDAPRRRTEEDYIKEGINTILANEFY